MKKILLLLLLCLASTKLMANKTIVVTAHNTLNVARTDVPIVISLSTYGDIHSAVVRLDKEKKEIPCQLDDLNQDDTFDELCFLADFEKKEKLTFTVTLLAEGAPRSYPARVYAEMLLRNGKVKEKNKHNNYIESITARGDCADSYQLQHHHGVDFESELNGIRIYFDKRQTLDLYGKHTKRLELQETQFYTTPEQKQQGYGDDVLWVGQTFGLGAFRGWDGRRPTHIDPVRSRTQRIISYGPLRTIVELEDRGWKADTTKVPLNLILRYTQYAGHRDTDVDVIFNKDVRDYRFSTGIINVKGSEEFSDHKGLRACWGSDYPAADTTKWKRETVGLAVWVPTENIASEEPANKDNYTYVLKIDGNKMAYKVTYTSANETFGYHSAQEWFQHLTAWKREVEHPIKVTIKEVR